MVIPQHTIHLLTSHIRSPSNEVEARKRVDYNREIILKLDVLFTLPLEELTSQAAGEGNMNGLTDYF